jgi:multidrug efflux pump subunit AcrA (membrane-fusion protein)
MSASSAVPSALQLYFSLASTARQAATQQALQFLICNDTRGLVPFRQSMLFLPDRSGQWRLTTHSGLSLLNETTPYQMWLEALIAWQQGHSDVMIQRAAVPEALQKGWEEWLPAGVMVLPLSGVDGIVRALWLLARDELWQWPATPPDAAIWLSELQAVYGHALWAWMRPQRHWRIASLLSFRAGVVGVLALSALACVPVRLSVLAPAEMTPLNPYIISAPMEGVVKRIPVTPGAMVKKGESVVELDDTLLVNRRQVLEESLRTARADLLQAEQQSFEDQANGSRAALSVLRGKVNEKEAELDSLARQSARLQIRAPEEGVFIYSDQLDWAGKPLQTGERIGLLANPTHMNVTVWVAASDAINLEQGAEVKLYLHTAPLQSLSATLTETSFTAQPNADGVVSYRIKARLDHPESLARIGLKGTAKLYGERVPLVYWLLRRPLASLRAWSGW